MSINQFLETAENMVRVAVERCETDSHIVIARYTAAIAGNFQKWLGFTTPVHPYSQWAIADNLHLEKEENHDDMLRDFAKFCKARPEMGHYDYVGSSVRSVNALFQRGQLLCGLHGLALAAVLENTSKIFIPDLAKRAKECGCTDFTYTDKHGEADVAHSDAFRQALEKERSIEYSHFDLRVREAISHGLVLIRTIFS